jgi:hypothetical protein
MQETQFVISQDLLNKTIQYISTRPLNEVMNLFNALVQLKPAGYESPANVAQLPVKE